MIVNKKMKSPTIGGEIMAIQVRRKNASKEKRIGIVGTGFIAKGLIMLLLKQADMVFSKILTRRQINVCDFLEKKYFTNSVDDFIHSVDLVVECSGDVNQAALVTDAAFSSSLPVVTMNTEFQVTVGSYFVKKGVITEAEGDQPGCLASFNENVIQMGFQPLVYGNIKGFLNHTPTKEDMHFWAKKSGISLQQVTSFTDGTKVQMEQALVANGLGATIAKAGLLGMGAENNDDIKKFVSYAEECKAPISDYILAPKYPAGVFIVASHDEEQAKYLHYYKMGEGPHYVLLHNFHLCHLEILKTIRAVLLKNNILLNNSENPTISVAAVAKRDICRGEFVKQGIGGFDFRGEAVKIEEAINHVPIGLISEARIAENLEKNQRITFADIELPDSFALNIWKKMFEK
ncbi:MAG: NAD(P)-dependent oxidoreductase [Candidatus Moraniibacteriota bacterium]